MTQKEIAKLLNVSQPTVSMALNGSERISRELRDAVRKLADRSGYRPNLAGQLLRQGRSNVVGAVFPSLTNNFFAELFQELQNQLIPHGYLLYLVQPGADGELPAAAECLRRMQAAGVIAIGSAAESLLRLKEDGIALVLYGGDSRLELGVSQVLPDRYAAGREAVRHLLAAGRRRIAFLGMKNPQEPRCRAYLDVLAEAGLEPLTFRAGEDGDSPEAGCRAAGAEGAGGAGGFRVRQHRDRPLFESRADLDRTAAAGDRRRSGGGTARHAGRSGALPLCPGRLPPGDPGVGMIFLNFYLYVSAKKNEGAP